MAIMASKAYAVLPNEAFHVIHKHDGAMNVWVK